MTKIYMDPYDVNGEVIVDENGITLEHCHLCCVILDFNVLNVENKPVFCEDCIKSLKEEYENEK